MDLIVTGGRHYNDVETVQRVLDLFDYSLLIHGGATGADSAAAMHSELRGIPTREVLAEWHVWGKAAGPKRNREMLLKYPNALVIAFPGGAGTKNCMSQAIQLGMTVLEVKQALTPSPDRSE